MCIVRGSCNKLKNLTITKPLSENMKMILKKIDPQKYGYLELIKTLTKQKKDEIKSSPW